MSETKNLRLFKHNEPLETNENKFDIDLALNQNWDKIEEFADMVNDKVIELEDKDEEQDFNLQELQNEIKKDRENMINLETEGQSIHIEDSSDLEGKLEVLGNMEQDVREGKNLYNAGKTIDDYFITSGAKGNVITQYKAKDYVTCKIDKGVMTIEKYNTSGYNWVAKWIEIEKNTEYTISLDKSLTSVSVLGFSTKENKTEGVIIAELNASKKEVNFNSGDYAFYAVSFYPKQGLEIAIQIEEGKQKTEFEQYGASPSPEHPSEIRAVGDKGSVEIKKTTANYYDLQAGISNPANEDGWITLKGTNTGTSITYLNYFTTNLDLVIGKKYWIVAEIKSVSGEGNFNITSRMYNQGQFNAHEVSLTDLKSGDLVIYSEVALNTQGTEQGLRTFISLPAGKGCNITFRISVLETEPNKSNWKYVPYKKETKILPIQKPMLEGDHFNRIDNKEVHTWKKIVLDGVNNKVTQTTTNLSGKYRYQYIDKDLKNCSLSEEKAYCTHLPLIEKSKTYDKILGFTVANNSIYIYTDGDTAVNFNAKLQNENYIFYIPVIESAYQNLDLTPEQIEILDELDNFQTYKPVTNITTDSIAKLKLKYIADTKTYIDNKTSNLEQQVSVINQLLSTTKTSSVLLDNLQTDIESEVL